MFSQERHEKILVLLEKNDRVSVNELSSTFGVSVDTIRRDLKSMEQEGLLKRTHGGAINPRKSGVSAGFSARKKMHIREKSMIAQKAVSLIQDDDTLLLDGSTTTASMIPYLGAFSNLTIFTNSISVAGEISHTHKNIKVFIIGGLLHPEHGSTISIESISFIKKLFVDKVFVGSCSISHDRGLSSTFIDDAAIKKAMLKAGSQIIILADSSKFVHESLVQIAPLKSEYTIITDSGFDTSFKELYKPIIEKGLRIIIAL